MSAGGLGLGVLVSAAFVEVLPAPRVLPYVALFVLFAIALAGALRMPEPIAERSRPRLTPQRPSVPPVVRGPFALAAVAVISSWSVGGLFMSLGPQLSATLFHTNDHLVAGAGVFALGGSAAVAQLLFGRATPWLSSTLASLALAIGLLIIVLASATESSALFLTGVIVGGGGFGVAFLSALRGLSAAIPPAHRAEVMSAFYVVAYASLSLPAIAAGIVVTPLGLEPTFELFGSIVAGLALVAAGMAWRTRPQPKAGSARPAVEAAGA